MTVNQIRIKSSYKVTDIKGDEQLKMRLLELGIYKGMDIEYLGQAPFWGPYLFKCNNMILALRDEEALCLHLEH